jgi:hypothetical protein
MADSDNAPVIGGHKSASHRAANGLRRRAEQETILRRVASFDSQYVSIYRDNKELHDAIREVAVPAVDEVKKRDRDRIRSLIGAAQSPFPNVRSTKTSRKGSTFEPSDDYCLIRSHGRKYLLTPHAARLAKAFHNAAKQGRGLTVAEIKRVNKGGPSLGGFSKLRRKKISKGPHRKPFEEPLQVENLNPRSLRSYVRTTLIVVYWRDIDFWSRHRPERLIIARESTKELPHD